MVAMGKLEGTLQGLHCDMLMGLGPVGHSLEPEPHSNIRPFLPLLVGEDQQNSYQLSGCEHSTSKRYAARGFRDCISSAISLMHARLPRSRSIHTSIPP
jgi:hypothetical protein